MDDILPGIEPISRLAELRIALRFPGLRIHFRTQTFLLRTRGRYPHLWGHARLCLLLLQSLHTTNQRLQIGAAHTNTILRKGLKASKQSENHNQQN